jgi:hypothetical protein
MISSLLAQPDIRDLEPQRQPVAKHLVVVAGNVGDLGARPRMPQDQPQHLVVMRVPVPGLAQPPAIDDVADQIQLLAAHAFQEIGEKIGPAAAGAEMHVGDEDAAVAFAGSGNDGVHAGDVSCDASCDVASTPVRCAHHIRAHTRRAREQFMTDQAFGGRCEDHGFAARSSSQRNIGRLA